MTDSSLWKKQPPPLKDPILYLYSKCLNDPRPQKINLTAGIYKDENLEPFVIEPIKTVIDEIIECKETSVYDSFIDPLDNRHVDLLIDEFYKESVNYRIAVEENRVVRIPVQSGGNGLFFGFRAYKSYHKTFIQPHASSQKPMVWVSDPSWPIHLQKLQYHKIDFMIYPYYDEKSNSISFDKMMSTLENMNRGDMLLLQVCGHNPTGFDPSFEQWMLIAELCLKKQVIVFFDFAYMGFASGSIEKDSIALNLFLDKKVPFFVAFSCAKNFGLYALRVGFFLSILNDQNESKWLFEFLKKDSHLFYDRPTSFGPLLVRRILENKEGQSRWYDGFKLMNKRLFTQRIGFVQLMKDLGSKIDWSFITNQNGMFAYTGLSKQEIEELQEKYAIFMIGSGRISVAGLNQKNLRYFAESVHQVTSKRFELN